MLLPHPHRRPGQLDLPTLVDMGQASTLSADEAVLLTTYRRLKSTGREFRLEALGLARTPQMLLEVRSTEFRRVPIDRSQTLSHALD